MAKTYDRCKLCNANKFLNSAGLCKRCGKSPESVDIRDAALKKRAELREAKAELAQQEAQEQAQEETTQEVSTETSESGDSKDKNESSQEKKE